MGRVRKRRERVGKERAKGKERKEEKERKKRIKVFYVYQACENRFKYMHIIN